MASQVAYKGRNRFHRDTVYSPAKGSSLWESCPLLSLNQDPACGVIHEENWQGYDATASTGDWTLTQATTGAAAISTERSGVLELDSNSTTSTQGAQIQRLKSVFVPVASSKIWAEFDIKIVDTFDKVELFVGLAASDTTIIATSAMSTNNHIGWKCVTDDGVLLFTSDKAGTGTTKAAATIAEATFIKLGFIVTGVTSIQQYINGVATSAAIATANIPIVAMYPSFVCQSAGTNDPIMHIKPYRIVQLYDA